MEVSNNDIKPTVLKCAEDLAEFLFKRRKDGMEFAEKEMQTTAPYPTGKSQKNTEATKSRSNAKDAKDAIKKNQELLSEYKLRIEMLKKDNSNLEKQIKNLYTQKVLSSVKMLEDDVIVEIQPHETEKDK